MSISTQNQPQGVGISWAHLLASSSCFTRPSSIGGVCSSCPCLVMASPGTVISLWKETSPRHLGIQFGLFYVISRCSVWCLLAKWIKRSKDLERGPSCKCFDSYVSYVFFLFLPSSRYICNCISPCFPFYLICALFIPSSFLFLAFLSNVSL